jgi:hypothetical protein
MGGDGNIPQISLLQFADYFSISVTLEIEESVTVLFDSNPHRPERIRSAAI